MDLEYIKDRQSEMDHDTIAKGLEDRAARERAEAQRRPATRGSTAWAYLEDEPAPGAPKADNPSGLYCPACRAEGMSHCSAPEWCGQMRRMRTPTP